MNIVIAVAAHKPYWIPADDIYLPMQVGSLGQTAFEGCVRDDSGEQISGKNASYSELTGLYWLWKNTAADYIGITHYRRHFAHGACRGKRRRVIGRAALERALAKTM
jgi:hypothetical protein